MAPNRWDACRMTPSPPKHTMKSTKSASLRHKGQAVGIKQGKGRRHTTAGMNLCSSGIALR